MKITEILFYLVSPERPDRFPACEKFGVVKQALWCAVSIGTGILLGTVCR